MAADSVNIDKELDIGIELQKHFENGWPKCFDDKRHQQKKKHQYKQQCSTMAVMYR